MAAFSLTEASWKHSFHLMKLQNADVPLKPDFITILNHYNFFPMFYILCSYGKSCLVKTEGGHSNISRD